MLNIFSSYSKYIKHIFAHIMGILEKKIISILYGLFKNIPRLF
jgi:hypothetical protein